MSFLNAASRLILLAPKIVVPLQLPSIQLIVIAKIFTTNPQTLEDLSTSSYSDSDSLPLLPLLLFSIYSGLLAGFTPPGTSYYWAFLPAVPFTCSFLFPDASLIHSLSFFKAAQIQLLRTIQPDLPQNPPRAYAPTPLHWAQWRLFSSI